MISKNNNGVIEQEEVIQDRHRFEEEIFTLIYSAGEEIIKKDFSKRFMDESNEGLEEMVDKSTSIKDSLVRRFSSLIINYDNNVKEYRNEIFQMDIATEQLSYGNNMSNMISELIDYKEKGTLPEDINLYNQQQLSCELPYLRDQLGFITKQCHGLQVEISAHNSRAAMQNKQNQEMNTTIDKYVSLVCVVNKLLEIQSQSNDTHTKYDAGIRN
jgi:hypothetical protein